MPFGPALPGVPDETFVKLTTIISPSFEYIQGQLAKFRLGISDLSPLWDMFSPIMAGVEQRQFDEAGGGSWEPLAESTVVEKQQGGWPLDPLVRSGSLRDSLVNPGMAEDRGPTHYSWGTDVPYARYHQEGTRRMPQRQVIPDPIKVEDRRKFEGAMVTYVNQLAAGTFGNIRPGRGGESVFERRIPINLRPFKDAYRDMWWEREAEKWIVKAFIARVDPELAVVETLGGG